MDNHVLYPGGTIGVIGDSTDGPMIVSAARQAGFKVGAYGSDETSEMLQLADFKIVGDLSDHDRLVDFAERCDLVTYDSQHLSPDVLSVIEGSTTLPQGSDFQMMMQDRLLERAFYEQLNVNILPYATIVSLDDVYQSINSIGYPSVLKPIQKDLVHGQEMTIRTQTDIAQAAGLMDWGTYILESTVDYSRELTVTVVRTASGEASLFPPVEIKRQNGQMTWAYLPVSIDPDVQTEMDRICHEIVANVKYVGVFEVDFMLNDNGSLYVKQIIPTFGEAGRIFDRATTVSQFEQHLRAIAGMPLSDIQVVKPTVMAAFTHDQANAIRTQWTLKPNWHFSFYRQGHQDLDSQKLAGHILVQGDDVNKLLEQLEDTEIWSQDSADSENN
ncbi:ATP-grasp domain-containing protein [Secundilactobacillus hailunensis]|uniref:ATP-grasp domain-containing protein n=1 Tax=Secundilactobacillus hailunensis TaxID=2559923 RepID=A0ABW1TB45_9LACO|nr:ATP-grasp domain-containing protein [Secundilactobacillus hailunensis]